MLAKLLDSRNYAPEYFRLPSRDEMTNRLKRAHAGTFFLLWWDLSLPK